MEHAKLALLAELPGLQAAKAAIDARILLIESQMSEIPGMPTGASPLHPPPPINDPTFLGYDSRGRIKRKRTLSPEVIEQKRKLIAEAREKRTNKIATAAVAQAEAQRQASLATPARRK